MTDEARKHALILLSAAEHAALLHQLRGFDLGEPLAASALRKLRAVQPQTFASHGMTMLAAARNAGSSVPLHSLPTQPDGGC